MENNKPKYVWFNGTVLRRILLDHQDNEGYYEDYWCDNGCWGLTSYFDVSAPWPQLMSKRSEHFKTSVNLMPATEAEWLNCVGHYAPQGYILEDGTKWTEKRFDRGDFSYNPCREIPLGELQNGTRFTHFNGEPIEDENNYMYLLI